MKQYGRNQRRRSGFTIVELLLAVVISSIVVMAAGTLYIFQTRSFMREQNSIRLCEETTLAMNTIGNRIRTANIDDGEVDFVETALRCTLKLDSDGYSYIVWERDDNELILMPEKISLISEDFDIRKFYAKEYEENGSWYVVLEVQDPVSMVNFVVPCNYKPRNQLLPD